MTHVMEQLTLPGLDEAVQGSSGRGRWPMVKLGDVCDFFAGSTLPDGNVFSNQLDGFFILKVSDMNTDGNEKVILNCQTWSKSAGQKSSTCPAGTIIIPKRGGAIGTNKKRIINRCAILDPNLMGITPNPLILNLQFCYYWFLGFDLSTISNGSSVPQLNKQDLVGLKIPLPPLPEQQLIVARLDKAQQLIDQRKEQLALMDALVQSLFYEMFGDPVKNEKGWELDILANLIDSSDSISYGIVQPGDDFPGGIPIVRPVDFDKGVVDISQLKKTSPEIESKFKKTRLVGNEILLSVRGTTGVSFVTNESFVGFNVTRGIAVIRPVSVNTLFLNKALA